MSPQRMRSIQDWLAVASSITAIVTVVVGVSVGWGRLESQAQAGDDRNREQDVRLTSLQADVMQYLRSIDQRLSRMEGRLEKP